MSETTIISIWPNDRTEKYKTLRNSHGSCPRIWDYLSQKYLGTSPFGYSETIEELWPLYKSAKLPDHQRAVLMMTYDNVYISKIDYFRAAADIKKFGEDFPENENYVNHWPAIAEIFKSNPDFPALGFWMTSVSENPFDGPWNEEAGEHDPPDDWLIFWDLYTKFDELKSESDNTKESKL